MKIKFVALAFIFSLSWISSAQAYPWNFLKQDEPKSLFEIDVHAAYFIKGQTTAFSNIGTDYHNPMLDINLGWTYSFFEEAHYFRVSELALIFPFIFENWNMTLGFKDVLWSVADRYWNYGLWQSRYMLDAFRPVQMGLPGLYFNYEGTSSFLLLLSYFYLPDIMTYPELKGGRITSINPFFMKSFSQGVHWNVKKFNPFQISRFFKPVVALQFKHSLRNSNVSFAYAYKPVNQLQYSVFFSGINLSDPTSKNFSVNDFDYSVMSHHLFSVEGEVIFNKEFSLFTSLFYEKPDRMKYRRNWISDDFEPHLTFSVLSSFEESLKEGSKSLFTIGYTQTIESSLKEHRSNFITEDLEIFFGRDFNWRKALAASIEYQDTNLLHGLLFRFRANYTLDNSLYVLSLENHLNLSSHIQVYFSGDAIFRLSFRKLRKNTSAISKYKRLSRALIGGKYVF